MFPKAVTGSLERSGGATPRVVIEARDLEKVYGRGEGGVEALGSVSGVLQRTTSRSFELC